MLSGYHLFPSHHLALETLGSHPELVDLSEVSEADRDRFAQRLSEVPEDLRSWWLAQYANPVINCARSEPSS